MPYTSDKLPYAGMYCGLCESKDIIFHIQFDYSQKKEFYTKTFSIQCLNCKTITGISDSLIRHRLNEMCFNNSE